MTFKDYLNKRRVTSTPNGDFVVDAKRDPMFPDVQSWSQLETYLISRAASVDVVDAAKQVWKGYERALNVAK